MQKGKLSIFVGVFIAAVGKIENTGLLLTIIYAFIGGGAAYLGKVFTAQIISKIKLNLKNRKRMKIVIKKHSGIVWLLDNGHGIDTLGKRSDEIDGKQLFEWQFNRNIVKKIADKLENAGLNYGILVVEDKDVLLWSENELTDTRVRRANDLRCGLPNHRVVLVSIHGNASSEPKANGIEVFTSPGETESDKIATIFIKHLQEIGLKMREDTIDGDPDKEAKFAILTKTSCPAILSENGFYTNKEEMEMMLTDEFQEKVAQAHFDAMMEIEEGKKTVDSPVLKDKKKGKNNGNS